MMTRGKRYIYFFISIICVGNIRFLVVSAARVHCHIISNVLHNSQQPDMSLTYTNIVLFVVHVHAVFIAFCTD